MQELKDSYVFYDIQQNSDEWEQLRGGKLTQSNLGTVMANYGKSFGEPAKRYAHNIALEQITGVKLASGYCSPDMKRGTLEEPIARLHYENYTFTEVLNGGFYMTDFMGSSPDGRISDIGAIEIKSVLASTHFDNIKRETFDPANKWQLYGNLKCMSEYTNSIEWIDYISFCSEYPEDKKLFINRIYKKNLQKEFDMIDTRVNEFKELVLLSKDIILNNKYNNYGEL